ncbi:hypothetical protein ERO13_A13G036650v2 [Gossypium hirsutum]|uniref:TF-B3 domain-containing protein n=4 Tax=Gossypium TaxID=3633 RepID=A0A2P5YGG2_GOSBA|nr:hypothetical protein ES319_A13G039200v1 [Gossypium barbadense]KAG4164758.1 hypothetical protein ERO13_A13G036650v2 [Gossypium hirsutum]TYG85244.1 hypothetical protein ES288_A13G037800v1 [Gossypium darwinii]TYH90309.1 hypothetical protein ES332_A13G040900v1 [Gossypium tomentosum]TYI99746.1 hypothetical protein E1A91_A13G038800v1 [Gossypium mustelinum]
MGVPPLYSETNEIFSKDLSKTDVGVRLSFPMKALKDFQFLEGENKTEFEAADGIGNRWRFGLSKRKARHSKFHPKPVLSSGWLAYVKAKGLQINDRFFLYGDLDKLSTKKRFRVQAQRKVRRPIKLFGKEILVEEVWVDIEELEGLKQETSRSIS